MKTKSFKIPIFEEVIIDDYSDINLKSIIRESKVGKVPCYISLRNFNKVETKHIVDRLQEIFADLGTHPLFPFPTYLISEFCVQNSIFSFFKKVEALPQHFFKKVKRLTRKELDLLNKIYIVSENIKNIDSNEAIARLKKANSNQKKLYNLSKELYFYENLLTNIHTSKMKETSNEEPTES